MRPISLLNTICCLMLIAVVGQVQAGAVSDLDLEWFRDRPTEVQWGPDPFLPKVRIDQGSGNTSGQKYILTAVILGGEKPAAVIDGEVVHAGEKIGSNRVVKILKDSVVLKGPSGLVEVPLKPLFSLGSSLP
ncbi:MAG: hypothetical protein V3R44_01930 [bacterium]